MKTLYRIINKTLNNRAAAQPPASPSNQCNYANNYYGDQACMLQR